MNRRPAPFALPPAPSTSSLLSAATLGVYALIVLGATTAVLDGAAACPSWPTCGGVVLVPAGDAALLVAWLHRAATLVVAGLVLAAAVAAWRRGTPRRVRSALAAAVALYPAQIALGAIAATGDAPAAVATAHLVVAMAIFTALLVALGAELEAGAPGKLLQAGRNASGAAPATGSVGAPAEAETGPRWGPGTGTSLGPAGRLRAYVALTKPRLWWLLCLVALAAMGLAAGPALDPVLAAWTLVGGVLAIAASGTLNNVIERDADGRMARTSDRPLASGRLPVRNAVAFGLVLAAASVAVFAAFVNVLVAGLGLLAILFYSVIYTVVLKPHTARNTVLGGAVGAFPALIGWAAVEGTVGVPALVLGAVIFLWTPAHFYNLALVHREDYRRAGFPMLPVVRGSAVTRRHILGYLGATMLATAALGATTRLDWAFALVAVVVAGVFLRAVVRLHAERDRRAAYRAFHASNAYLGAVLLAVLVDVMVL